MINIAPFFSLCCARLIVCTTSKDRFSLFLNMHLSVPIVFSLLVFPINKHFDLQLNEFTVYIALIFGNFFCYFLYVLNAMDQIKNCLGIYILTIKPKKND